MSIRQTLPLVVLMPEQVNRELQLGNSFLRLLVLEKGRAP